MEIVINIPTEVRNRLTFGVTYKDDLKILAEALSKGTLLPKGHGRLIDADRTLKNAEEIYNASNIKDTIDYAQMYAIRKILTTVPTIIEESKEESEVRNADNN